MSYVYILTNHAMPGIIKIGLTENQVTERLLQLDTTSVPVPFQCFYAARVEDNRRVERALHTAFGDFRIRANREFFRMDPFRVKAILEVLALEDVTPRSETVGSPDDIKAMSVVGKRGKFKFSSANVPVGSTLNFVKDLEMTAVVQDDETVLFDGLSCSLTAAALTALKKCGFNWSSVQGPEYWLFNGETVGSLRSRQRELLDSEE